MCFNNVMPYPDDTTYDTLYDCTPKFVDMLDFEEYGYATAFDYEGNAYLIRLFTIRQSNTIGSVLKPQETDGVVNQTETGTNTSTSTKPHIGFSIMSNLRGLVGNLKKNPTKKLDLIKFFCLL